MTRGLLAWLAWVVPVGLVLVLCTHWEPVMGDGWGHLIWHRRHDLSLSSLWEVARASYHHNNPRLGQVFTLIQHTPGPWHAVITPIIELSLFVLLATLVRGRWPSLRRTDDALLCATIVAMVFVCTRSLGPMLFYRPYSGNYVFGLVVCLLWLVPYRLHAAQRFAHGWWLVPIMAVLGVAAGMCNEHTGPAFIAAAVFALVVYWRRGERFVPWAWVGLAGMIAGAALLFFAPGQDIRYHGLATQHSLLERIVERGVIGNAVVLLLFVLYVSPLLLWVALAIASRRRNAIAPQPRTATIAQLALLGTAVLIVGTLLVSPKQGDRLYLAPICLASAAAADWVVARLGRVERWIAAGAAVVVIAYVGWRLVSAYHVAGREFAARIAAIEAAPAGSTVTVEPYSQERTRYVLGDDFATAHRRARIAQAYGLAAIEWKAPAESARR